MAAEEAILGSGSSGAGGVYGSDLFLATFNALNMEAAYGLGSGLTFLSGDEPSELMAALRINPRLQARVEEVLQAERRRASGILSELGRPAIEAVASRLLGGKRLGHAEVSSIITVYGSRSEMIGS